MRKAMLLTLLFLSIEVFGQTQGLMLKDNTSNPNIKVNISSYYGGSVDYIVLKKGDGTWTANLVLSGSGLNLESDFMRIGSNVATYLDPTLVNDQEEWESDYSITDQEKYEPRCMNGYGKVRFLWNPTQTGQQPKCGTASNQFDPSKCFQPNNGGMCESFPTAISYDSQGHPQVHYVVKDADWLSYGSDNPPSGVYAYYPQYVYEGSVWEDGTVTLSSGTAGAYTLNFHSRWRLSRQDYYGNVVPTSQQLYCDDRIFFGSGSLLTSYAYDPTYAADPYHMRPLTNLPSWSANMAPSAGWRPALESAGQWKPFIMMSNQQSPPTAWVLIYTAQNSKATAYAGRVIQTGPTDSDGVYGNVSSFKTYFYFPLSTDSWTPFYTDTYVIIGRTEAAVMSELSRISGGVYP